MIRERDRVALRPEHGKSLDYFTHPRCDLEFRARLAADNLEPDDAGIVRKWKGEPCGAS